MPQDQNASLSPDNPWKPVADWQDQESADAARWRYVRDSLTRGGSPHMDGTWTWRFGSPSGRGRTVDEVIDHLIAQEKAEAAAQIDPEYYM